MQDRAAASPPARPLHGASESHIEVIDTESFQHASLRRADAAAPGAGPEAAGRRGGAGVRGRNRACMRVFSFC